MPLIFPLAKVPMSITDFLHSPVVVIAYSAWPTEVVSFRDMVPCWAARAASLQKPRGGTGDILDPELQEVLTDKRTSRRVFRCAPSTQVSENAKRARAILVGIPVMRASVLEHPGLGDAEPFMFLTTLAWASGDGIMRCGCDIFRELSHNQKTTCHQAVSNPTETLTGVKLAEEMASDFSLTPPK
ncbi:uncharacterized protein CLUP02_10815 [Colletotrichum lupini]|uniref:Uncharacterized protein n=1 Tax=Colletotrichum lupini TaxID=145971 RepID=A0A9Q8SXG5_9PEZI|nr:uncharacterized protein CLUP02_10815 [Colletotrichum lupini]UQC85318.1 hypothetical protein CLUP02_10815 [Colletotrichum lupini]